MRLAVFLLASVIATPYVHNYDLTLCSFAVLLVLLDGKRNGYRPGERATLSIAWFLPLAVVAFNGWNLPLGPLVLATSLGFAAVRASSTPRHLIHRRGQLQR